MGPSPSEYPDLAPPPLPLGYMQRPEPKRRYILLFALTVLTTTYAGQLHWASFVIGFSDLRLDINEWSLFLRGFWYSVPILGILGAHEFGHYYACRFYRVDASIPYFLPAPLPLTGTLGAFIRIRQPIPGKRALFDIGIAGPIAGFLVALPVLAIGVSLSRVVRIPEGFQGLELGEPLLLKAMLWLAFGTPPDGYSVNLHPTAFAGWFGLLATALNLFPMGQLDGGHISYAVLGRRSTQVTYGTILCLIGLSFVSSSWIVWTVLTVGMLLAFGPRHPRTYDEDMPLDASRKWLAAFAVLMFVLSFTPAPIETLDLVTGP
jgi:membrane-associated protease RseP (regulator of RpoE activity)